MLAQLSRVARWTRTWGRQAPLSAEESRTVEALMERIQGELVRPFLALHDLGGMEWDAWVRWAEPIVLDLVAQAGPVLLKPELLTFLEKAGPSLFAEEEQRLLALSPELRATFHRSIDVGLSMDMAWAKRIAELGGPEKVEPMLAARADLSVPVQRRTHGAIGFSLAFILLLETLSLPAADLERATFLVLKLKRMAAVLYAATRTLLAALA